MLAPFPWNVSLGSIQISAHGFFEAAAYLVGGWLYNSQRKQSGDVVSDSERSSVLVAAVLGALVGSKLLYYVEDPMLTLASWKQPEYILGGKTIVGGLLGGTAAVEWVKRRMGVRRRTGDLLTLPLMVGMAIGRIGCFVSGLADHTYGIATSLLWGIDLGDGIARHPVQLYEIGFLALAAVAIRSVRHSLPEGGQFRLFLMLYCGWRLAIDFLKPGIFIAGMTTIQWTCVIALVWYSRNLVAWFSPRTEAVHG
ncbi:MAG: prolipoprotein diacylglyceryl transferase family protein [Bryobacteraceae bacterium]